MKNIHVLPTDKPSRLWVNNLLQGKLELSIAFLIGSNTTQNIYITSDEEIKEGDWSYNEDTNIVAKCIYIDGLSNGSYIGKKIILTTDQDLIKHGVQAIDDEFLEWFVKNSSCESVKIGKGYFKNDYEESFKIIIPKEEPKQELDINTCKNFDRETGCDLINCRCEQEEPTQETLEKSKQTAVEWLAEQMLHPEFHNPYIEQAKEMEKQQRDDFAIEFLIWCNSKESVDLINDLQIVGELDGEYTAIQLLEIFKNK